MRSLRIALDALGRLLPNDERVVLVGMGHTAALDEDHPDRVARHLRAFFTSRVSERVSVPGR
jgi:hypothetical protein